MENNQAAPRLADTLTAIALQQLEVSTDFKKDRMDRIKKFEDLYAGRSSVRLRVQYDSVLPVFAGMVDALEVEFDDPPYLKFRDNNPVDYFAARKIQAAWETEAFASTPNAMWALKTRWDKHNAILSGRGILKFYAESDPEYQSVFDVTNYRDFHCEPMGGGHLENHLFCGQESIYRTAEDLKRGAEGADPVYDPEQVRVLMERSSSQDWKEELSADYREKMNRFIALGQDPSKYNFVGQRLFNLCEWCLTYNGERWYLVFDPFTKIWIRCEKLKDVYSGGFYPWVSWATHEDDRVFWSKSYCDDFYPAAQTIVDFVMQEFTSRNKKLMGAKLYDPQMIVNPADLNTAQYRVDQLVEVNVTAGKKLSDAVYTIPVDELGTATIDLVSWLESTALRQSGAEDITRKLDGGGGRGQKANVVFAQIQQAQKRIGHKAHSYVEAYNQIGNRYIQGLKDHFRGTMPIKILGPNGYENDELRRVDISTKHSLDIRVTSKREEDQDNVFGKKQKTDSLELLKDSKNINSKWRDEHILRDIGGWPEEEIVLAMDTQEFADKETQAKAAEAILQLRKGKMPLVNHKANIWFMEKIYNYALENQEKLGEKYPLFLQYVAAHKEIAQQNMEKLAGDINAGLKPPPGIGATPAGDQNGAMQPPSGPAGAMVRGAAGFPMQ